MKISPETRRAARFGLATLRLIKRRRSQPRLCNRLDSFPSNWVTCYWTGASIGVRPETASWY